MPVYDWYCIGPAEKINLNPGPATAAGWGRSWIFVKILAKTVYGGIIEIDGGEWVAASDCSFQTEKGAEHV